MHAAQAELIDRLLDLVEGSWPVKWGPAPRPRVEAATRRGGRGPDAWLVLEPMDGPPLRIALEVKRPDTDPPDAAALARRWRETRAGEDLVVLARWLGPAVRRRLEAAGVSYLDLTGNVNLTLARPAVSIQRHGADTNPDPTPPTRRALKGPKAGAIVRALCDARPPYGVSELAAAAGVSVPYASRVLATLDEEGIIERARRGLVVDARVPDLIRRWVTWYGLFETNRTTHWIHPGGPRGFEAALREAPATMGWTLTGSLAAAQLAPVAAPSLGVAYADDPESLAEALGLLPADVGANVVLAAPYHPVCYRHAWRRAGLCYAAPAQIAMDCLTGAGRMPQEGEALLGWMQAQPERWRAPDLDSEPALSVEGT